MWYTYILSCADGTLYTGVTTDLERRLQEHNSSALGAKYTKARRPVCLVRFQNFATRQEAAAEEWRIKKMSRVQKNELIGYPDMKKNLHQ